jgi:hypothetical protein
VIVNLSLLALVFDYAYAVIDFAWSIILFVGGRIIGRHNRRVDQAAADGATYFFISCKGE